MSYRTKTGLLFIAVTFTILLGAALVAVILSRLFGWDQQETTTNCYAAVIGYLTYSWLFERDRT